MGGVKIKRGDKDFLSRIAANVDEFKWQFMDETGRIDEKDFSEFSDYVKGATEWMSKSVEKGVGTSLYFGFPSIVTVMIERALNGISFSFYVLARVRFISENTVPSETGTVLALLTTSMIYFYSIFGTSAAGYVFDTLGPRWLYVIAAFGYLASFVILLTARSRAAKA